MSTNYYWKDAPKTTTWTNPIGDVAEIKVNEDDPAIHICKRAHTAHGLLWTWAQEPEKVLAFCMENLASELIVDEYGDVYACADFLDMAENGKWDRDLIGKTFC